MIAARSTRVARTLVVLAVAAGVLIGGISSSSTANRVAAKQVAQAIALGSYARTAFDAACQQGTLRAGMRNADFDLAPPGIFSVGHLASLRVTTADADSGLIAWTFKAVTAPVVFGLGEQTVVADGATLIYRAECGKQSTLFTADRSSTLDQVFWPAPTAVPHVVANKPVAPTQAPQTASFANAPRTRATSVNYPDCDPGRPGVEQFTPIDPRLAIANVESARNTIPNRLSVEFVDALAHDDIVDAVCSVNGTIVTYLPGMDVYGIEIAGSDNLTGLHAALERLRADPRVQWAQTVTVAAAKPDQQDQSASAVAKRKAASRRAAARQAQAQAAASSMPPDRERAAVDAAMRYAEQAIHANIERYVLEHHAMPLSNAAAGLPGPDTLGAGVVDSITLDTADPDTIIVTFTRGANSDLPVDARGRRITLVASIGHSIELGDLSSTPPSKPTQRPNSVGFICRTLDMPSQYLPARCEQPKLETAQEQRLGELSDNERAVAMAMRGLKMRRQRPARQREPSQAAKREALVMPLSVWLREGPAHQVGGGPRIILAGETGLYGCGAYVVEANTTIAKDEITVELLGAVNLTGSVCLTSVEPATLTVFVDVAAGRYPLNLVADGVVDRYHVVVTDRELRLEPIETTFSNAATPRTPRYPTNAFAYRCGSVDPGLAKCLELAQLLDDTAQVSALALVADEVPPPWRDARQGYAHAMAPRFYRYASPTAFDDALERVARFVVEHGFVRPGFAVAIDSWRGETMSSAHVRDAAWLGAARR